MWLRALLIAATAVAGGVAVGRSAVDKAVKSRVSRAVEIAKVTAIEDLRRETTSVVTQRALNIAAALVWKLLIVGALYLLHRTNDLTTDGFRISVLLVTIFFAVRDLFLALPHLWRGYVFVRGHEWKPAKALREFVASIVFERAYEKALEATSQRSARHAIAMSSFTEEALAREIAQAVSEVAKEASVNIVRMRVMVGLSAVAVVSLTYGAFVALALYHA